MIEIEVVNLSVTTNRLRCERSIAYKINLLKQRQAYYRRMWLDADVKINVLIHKLNDAAKNRMSVRRTKKRSGDGFREK